MQNFPRPKLPINPVLSSKSLTLSKARKSPPSILNNPHVVYLTSGRVGIAQALSLLGLGENDKVMIPAYHCSSMVEPAIWLNTDVIFYKIKANTDIDLDDIQNKLEPAVKAIMITHYFGFPQDLSRLKTLCMQNNICLIEDCAHAFIGGTENAPIGSTGDYAIASIMKFFPVFDGGCLSISPRQYRKLQLQAPGTAFELKSILNCLELAFSYHRLPLLKYTLGLLLNLKDALWKTIKRLSPEKNMTIGPSSAHGGYSFEASWVNKKASRSSLFVLKHTNIERLIQNRRSYYLQLHESLKGVPGIKPLFDELPEGVAPYVYPMIVENPKKYFPLLKNKRIPIVRFGEFLWEGVNETVCPNSQYFSEHVFQFPCHQELNAKELQWMIDTIRQTFECE